LRSLGSGATAALAVAAGAALVVLYLVDPQQRTLTLPCPYLTLTGFACPGCGLTRATHALLHGDVARAFAFNPWAFVSTPALVAFTALPHLTDAERTSRLRTGISWVMLAITLAFWVWRNTSAYPFTRV
jgi:hypothetical protein